MTGTVGWFCKSLGCHLGQAGQMWGMGMNSPTWARVRAGVGRRRSMNGRPPVVPDCGGWAQQACGCGRWLMGPALESLDLFQASLSGSHDICRTDREGQVLQGPALDTVTDLMFSLGVLALLEGPPGGGQTA